MKTKYIYSINSLIPFLFCSFLLNFAYADFGWNLPPIEISEPNEESTTPQVCCDTFGNAFAVWVGKPMGISDFVVKTSYFDGDTLIWSTPIQVSTPGEDASSPQVCCDNFGNAHIIWQRSNGSNQIIQSSTIDKETLIPSTPVNLSAPGENSDTPQICCNDSGNAFAVWRRFDVAQASIFNGTSWSPIDEVVTLSASGSNIRDTEICCDDSGNAIAIWARKIGPVNVVQSSHFNGTSWSDVNVLSDPNENARDNQICCDNSGNATAVWNGSDNLNLIIYASHFNGSSWTPTSALFKLSDPIGTAAFPQICCNESGNAIAAWTHSNGSNLIIQASRFNGTSWVPFEDGVDLSAPGQDTEKVQVCCDEYGNAIAIWQRSNGSNTIIQSSRFNGTSWTPIAEVDNLSNPGENAITPQVCCDSAGRVISIWEVETGSDCNIQETFYLPLVFPPASFQGNRVTNRFPSQSSTSAHLSWTPNTDPNITSFDIYRNGILIATVPSYLSSYKDCNIDPCQNYTYSIISENIAGDDSDAETITL